MTPGCIAGDVVRLPETPGGSRSWAPGALGVRLLAALGAAEACLPAELTRVALAYAAPAPCQAAAAAFVERMELRPGRVRPGDSLDLEAASALHPFLARHDRVRARYVLVTPDRGPYQAARWAVEQVTSGREQACLVAEAVWSEGTAIDVAAVALGRPGLLEGEPVVLEARAGWSLADLRGSGQ